MSSETSLFYDLKILLPVIAVALGGIFSLVAESFSSPAGRHKTLPWINLFFLFFATFFINKSITGDFGDPWNLFSINPVKEIFLYATALCAAIGTTALHNILKTKNTECGEAYSLLMFSAAGIMLMVLSTDLMPLFLGMELASFPIYALVAMNRRSKASNEAAFKYFISGAAMSAVFLYGMAMFYGATGSTLIGSDVLAGRENIYQAAIFLLSLGLLFKVGAFPLHFWVADAYTGALAAVTGYMAAVVKIGAFLGLGAIWFGLFGSSANVVVAREAVLFLCLGVASVVVGAITGLAQISARRILAFSAIANAGFILLGFCYPYFAKLHEPDLNSAFYFLLTYAIGSIGALAGISALMDSDYDDFDDLRATARKNPFLGICVSICLASLAGLPVAAGFLAKFRIFAGLVRASFDTPIVWCIAIVAFVLAVISAVYYIRIIYFMWSHAGLTVSRKTHNKVSALLNISVGAAAMALLALAVWMPM
ncbi:MAG: NADH-quinone oxidoreductase subunit N [Candidatus Fibromonas sp.]|jgi:NADH-quinone oxidoreductase subunit N|nr:NADH-quinone oxidoreductase subunit N [Candidatus Fibromonas sp.]